MFQHYTEKARRTIFYARYEASQFGSSYIETEHLLLGVLKEDKALASQFLASYAKVEDIRRSVERRGNAGVKIATSVDLPLSHESKRVLAYAAEESERMEHNFIGTPHLLLGLLREENSFAAKLLREKGLTLQLVRERVRQSEPPPKPGRSASIAGLNQWLAGHQTSGSIWTVKPRRPGKGAQFELYVGGMPQETKKSRILLPPQSSRRFRRGSISLSRKWSTPSPIMSSRKRASFRMKSAKSARTYAASVSSSTWSLVREICGSLNVQRRGKLQVADRLSCQISNSGVFRQVRLTFPLPRFWSTEERAVRLASHHHVNPMDFLIASSNA